MIEWCCNLVRRSRGEKAIVCMDNARGCECCAANENEMASVHISVTCCELDVGGSPNLQ